MIPPPQLLVHRRIMVAEGKADLAVDAAAGVGEKQESEQAQGPKGKVLVLQAVSERVCSTA